MGRDRQGNVVCDKCGRHKPFDPYAYCSECRGESQRTSWKIDEIFQDVPGDEENVKMVIPDEIVKQLDLNEGDTIRIQVTESGLVLSKI